jgi:hypothetical protein
MLATPSPIAPAVPPERSTAGATARLALVARALAPLGAAAARLTFAAPAATGALDRCTRLTIRGVAPRRLHRLCVREAGVTLLELGTLPDHRGGELTAGEMLAAMSTMDGHADLVVALPPPAAALQGLSVQLELSEPTPWSDACIEVLAGLA